MTAGDLVDGAADDEADDAVEFPDVGAVPEDELPPPHPPTAPEASAANMGRSKPRPRS